LKRNKDMPQFDTFIFSSSLTYFISSFFILLYLNFTRFIPRLGAIIKLRNRRTTKSTTIKDIITPSGDILTIFSRNIPSLEKN
jgi:hypothetical protein